MTRQTPSPIAVHAGQGEALWWFGSLAEIKATAADTGGQMTIIELTPGGFEGLVREMGEPAASRTVPEPSHEPPDMERVAAIAGRYGCELVGDA